MRLGTSGLDSHSAFSVISTLQQVSRLNVAVLCTIHQPSFEIFSKFDKVILMALGRIAFHGTIPEAIAHFEKLGYPLPLGANAADHFIALLTEPGNKEGASNDERDRVQHLLDAWSQIQGNNLTAQEETAKEHEAHTVDSAAEPVEQWRRGFGLGYAQELYWLTKRLVPIQHQNQSVLQAIRVLTKHDLQSMDPTSPFPCELHCWGRAIDLYVHRLGIYFLPPWILTRRRSWPRWSSVLYSYSKHVWSAVPNHHLRPNDHWPSQERA